MQRNRTDNYRRLAAFIFICLFLLHLMLIPVWLGFHGMSLFTTNSHVFDIVPVWFVTSGLICLILGLVFFRRPNPKAPKRSG